MRELPHPLSMREPSHSGLTRELPHPQCMRELPHPPAQIALLVRVKWFLVVIGVYQIWFGHLR